MFYFDPLTINLGYGKPKLRLTLNLGREQLTGPSTELRLVVYDLDAYIASQQDARDLAFETDPNNPTKFETGHGFFTGNETATGSQLSRELILPESLRSPKPEPFNGVIAVATLIFKRTETTSEIADQKQWGEGPWYVSQVVEGDFVTHRDTPFTIDVEMFAQRDDKGNFARGSLRRQKIGSIGFAAEFLKTSLETKRGLAFRLLSTKSQGPMREGTIALSSLNPRESMANRGNRPSRLVYVKIVEAVEKLQKPGAETPTDPGAADVPSRRKTPDLTGWYELVEKAPGVDPDSAEYVAPAALWINQAGEALVGWYYRMSALGVKRSFMGAAADLGPTAERLCFVSARSKTFPEGARIYWFSAKADEDPGELITGVQYPDAINDVNIRTGRYDIAEDGDDVATEVEFAFAHNWVMATDSEVDDSAPAEVARFRRLHTAARVAWISVEQMRRSGAPAAAMDELVRMRVEPLPLGFWSEIGRRLRAELTGHIKDFSRSGDLVVTAVFEKCAQKISAMLSDFPNPQYRFQVLSYVNSYANVMKFDDFTGGNPKTLTEWLRVICAARIELELKRKKESLPRNRPLTERERKEAIEAVRASVPPVFEETGSLEGEEFEYSFDFTSLSGGFTLVVGGAAGVTLCTIEKFKLVDGTPQPIKEYQVAFIGVFVGVGAGFSYELLVGKAGGAGGSGPVGCKIRSFHNISADAWGFTLFSVGAVGTNLGGSVPFIDIDVLKASSTLFTIRVNSEISLSKILNNAGGWDFSPGDVKKVLKDLEDAKILEAQATLFKISESVGLMYPFATIGRPPPPPELPVVPDQDSPIDANTNSSLVSFAKGSSVILVEQLLDFDRRLAMYRALFEIGGWYQCIGFGSPDWENQAQDPDVANKELSTNRAIATDKALNAALGQPDQGIVRKGKLHLDPHGDGRSTSMKSIEEGGGGLSDPRDPATPQSEIDEQKSEWPAWRRVDVVVNATLVARIKAP